MNQFSQKSGVMLKRRVMRRVYGVWFIKYVLPTFVLEIGIFTLAIVLMQGYMSFSRVFTTATDRAFHYSLANFSNYIVSAFYHAEWTTTALLFVALGVGSVIMRDSLRISRDIGRNFF